MGEYTVKGPKNDYLCLLKWELSKKINYQRFNMLSIPFIIKGAITDQILKKGINNFDLSTGNILLLNNCKESAR